MLADPVAFRPRPRPRAGLASPTAAPQDAAAMVLPAALATEALVGELLGWAGAVSPVATNLAGVVENVLGRVLEAFQAQVAAAAGGSAAARLGESVAMVQLMAKEPAAALLSSPVAFFVGRNSGMGWWWGWGQGRLPPLMLFSESNARCLIQTARSTQG